MSPEVRARSIPLYAALTCLTIAAGLASRRYPEFLPGFVAQYAGDTLWATMAFWLLAMVWRRVETPRLAVAAMTIAVAVECSQLYHAGWIDSVRKTSLGALALGSGFLWGDLACYAVGVCLAAALDARLIRARSASRNDKEQRIKNKEQTDPATEIRLLFVILSLLFQ